MNKQEQSAQREAQPVFEAPELTLIGDARQVILCGIVKGWDFRGYSAPEFEFVADEA